MHIAVIVLNWNHWQETLHCLSSLTHLKLEQHQLSIIVCDNASSNDSFTQIQQWGLKQFPQITLLEKPELSNTILTAFTLIQTGHNLGFAGGNNVGIRYALADESVEFVWILNNDTEVTPTALIELIHCATQTPEIALWGSTLVDFEQRDRVQCAGGSRYFPLTTIVRPVYAGQPLASVLNLSTQPLLDYVAGASLFLRVSAIRAIGTLTEDYFLYYEELDYTLRLKAHGLNIAWCPHSIIYHQGGASILGQDVQKLCKATYYENLSTLKFTARFYPRFLGFAALFRFCAKVLLFCLRRHFFLLRPLFKAYRDFFIGYKDISL